MSQNVKNKIKENIFNQFIIYFLSFFDEEVFGEREWGDW